MATTSSALPDAPFPAEGQPPAAAPAAYDREMLRVQLDLLRRESAVRARLEN